jgi:hypothetical protein
VLSPVTALLRRADVAAVIVAALVAKAVRRAGFRRIAAELARPAETVRGWLRCFVERAEAVRSVFTVWLRAVDADPVMPDGAGSGFADAMTAIAALAAAIGRRFVLSTVVAGRDRGGGVGWATVGSGLARPGSARTDPAADADHAVNLCAVMCLKRQQRRRAGGRRC